MENDGFKISYSGDQKTKTVGRQQQWWVDNLKQTGRNWHQLARDRNNWKILGKAYGRGKAVEEEDEKLEYSYMLTVQNCIQISHSVCIEKNRIFIKIYHFVYP